jgi:DNA-binding IclR family transcriptional regulator
LTAAVKSAVRTLRILELFSNINKELTLRDVSKALALPKSSTYMLLCTLVEEQYLEETTNGAYKISDFASISQSWIAGWVGMIRRIAAPEMDRLLEQFGHSVVLGRLTKSFDVQIIDARQSVSEMSYRVGEKPTIPSWCSCMGHAMLSKMPEQEIKIYLSTLNRKKFTPKTTTSTKDIMLKLKQWHLCGYALNIDERIDGASGIAVPILNLNLQPVAAINIVMLTPRFHAQKSEIIKALKSAAENIEKSIFLPTANIKPEIKSWLIG